MKQVYYLIFALFLISCQQSSSDLEILFKFPKSLKEISGITYNSSNKLIYAIQDRGNSSEIQVLNMEGKLTKSIAITNATNVDWEDITEDKIGNIYIGDFGNNDNARKDLAIYKVAKDKLEFDEVESDYKIEFSYPEQTAFPPKKTERLYDVEGFIELDDAFYLFTKNRSKNFDGTCLIYKVENKAGKQEAKLMGSFISCSNYNHCAITAAAISPNGEKVALLTHDQLILFTNFKSDDFLSGTRSSVSLNHFSQKEAITFIDNSTVLIADEKEKKAGGSVYKFKLKN